MDCTVDLPDGSAVGLPLCQGYHRATARGVFAPDCLRTPDAIGRTFIDPSPIVTRSGPAGGTGAGRSRLSRSADRGCRSARPHQRQVPAAGRGEIDDRRPRAARAAARHGPADGLPAAHTLRPDVEIRAVHAHADPEELVLPSLRARRRLQWIAEEDGRDRARPPEDVRHAGPRVGEPGARPDGEDALAHDAAAACGGRPIGGRGGRGADTGGECGADGHEKG